ncbi:hypothetical protein IO402_000441 [Campylobacter lari]|uniref:hypothetical protein n=1 Tax=Campylobacter lari TaxID=201 RepID=UPI001388131A|nr:hypothetical protein [Campylobacter lari]EAJ1269692.1 hypothetical protein [Campylobacter lari]EGK7475001.1 hypothetical protein [Campylobacter lari]EGK8087290.1 hypothetical protein [Campylobacter lari]MBT0818070.1 hypothetical protein [Campylobacter lari]MCR2069612.1 hypothetical protein [Campylobacter lari subsp. concheus]
MIFLHRQNNLESFIENYGIEIDLRYNGKLVLNHDLLEKNSLYPFFEEKIQFMKNIPIICNVKESGLEEKIIELLGNNFEYYFLDSQIPDILRLSKDGHQGKFIIRISDVESYNEKLMGISKPKYVWIDYSQFFSFDIKGYQEFIYNIKSKLEQVEPILVSPELYDPLYMKLIKPIQSILPKGFSVCTKKPELWSMYV